MSTISKRALMALENVMRPKLQLRPPQWRSRVGRRGARQAGPLKPLTGLAAMAWAAGEARGFTAAQWSALSDPSAALRDIIGALHAHRLPEPGEPWPQAVRTRFIALTTPRSISDGHPPGT